MEIKTPIPQQKRQYSDQTQQKFLTTTSQNDVFIDLVKQMLKSSSPQQNTPSSFSNSESSNCLNTSLGVQNNEQQTKRWWKKEEDELLKDLVQQYGPKNWKKIASNFPDRSDVQCLHRWQKVLNPSLVKGPWTKEEDQILSELVIEQGPQKWSQIAKSLPGRIGKQCRERWHNHLNPQIKKDKWTEDEDQKIIEAHKMYLFIWQQMGSYYQIITWKN
ncbi:myb-like DNA-binding domain protein [Ichthyophthirius multifiliis]|uniref:Myb-like DNA-binding domain protein n=1 Tax=Ichthyophthirius multifiliis TaxID=5932 RepID=G0QQV8_ICHMU|nr:myb-like DNA-binding domain protein [Ichthyophthirius multifiliis]EGR32388.1 myb-like DNA-binding domain protein [Ichthyophthirius multifiliis]|eukprot:XP_004035874.1 myb-like DNA-binding domain protein [Ichthyophthirius multifiliis]